MEIADKDLGQSLFFLYGTLDGLDGIVMPLDVEMVPDRLAAGGEAVEDQTSGFPESERVSLDGVGVVVGLDSQFLDRPGRARLKAADATRRARS